MAASQTDLGVLVRKVVRQGYADLLKLSNTFETRGKQERAVALHAHLVEVRQRVLRLTAIVGWAKDTAGQVDVHSLLRGLGETREALGLAAHGLHTTYETHARVSAPEYDIDSALEALATGSYDRLPKVLTEATPRPPSLAQQQRTLALLEAVVTRQTLSHAFPPGVDLSVTAGCLRVYVPRLYSLMLTVNLKDVAEADDPAALLVGGELPWLISGFELLVGTTLDGGKAARLALGPQQATQVMELLHKTVNASDTPLLASHNLMHSLCLRLRLDVLFGQAMELPGLGWAASLAPARTDTGLSCGYWLQPQQQQQKQQQQQQQQQKLVVAASGNTLDVTLEPKVPHIQASLDAAFRSLDIFAVSFLRVLTTAINTHVNHMLAAAVAEVGDLAGDAVFRFSVVEGVAAGEDVLAASRLVVAWGAGLVVPPGSVTLAVRLTNGKLVVESVAGLARPVVAPALANMLPALSDRAINQPGGLSAFLAGPLSQTLDALLAQHAFCSAAKAAGFLPETRPPPGILPGTLAALADHSSNTVFVRIPHEAAFAYVIAGLDSIADPVARLWLLVRSAEQREPVFFGPLSSHDLVCVSKAPVVGSKRRERGWGLDHDESPDKRTKRLDGQASGGCGWGGVHGPLPQLVYMLQVLRATVSRTAREHLLTFFLTKRNVILKRGADGIILHMDCGSLPVSSMVLHLADGDRGWCVDVTLSRPVFEVVAGEPSSSSSSNSNGSCGVAGRAGLVFEVPHITTEASGKRLVFSYGHDSADTVSRFLGDLKSVLRMIDLGMTLDASGVVDESRVSVFARSFTHTVVRVDGGGPSPLYVVVTIARSGFEVELHPPSPLARALGPMLSAELSSHRSLPVLLGALVKVVPALSVLDTVEDIVPGAVTVFHTSTRARVLLRDGAQTSGVDLRFVSDGRVHVSDAAESVFRTKSGRPGSGTAARVARAPRLPALAALLGRSLSVVASAIVPQSVVSAGERAARGGHILTSGTTWVSELDAVDGLDSVLGGSPVVAVERLGAVLVAVSELCRARWLRTALEARMGGRLQTTADAGHRVGEGWTLHFERGPLGSTTVSASHPKMTKSHVKTLAQVFETSVQSSHDVNGFLRLLELPIDTARAILDGAADVAEQGVTLALSCGALPLLQQDSETGAVTVAFARRSGSSSLALRIDPRAETVERVGAGTSSGPDEDSIASIARESSVSFVRAVFSAVADGWPLAMQ